MKPYITLLMILITNVINLHGQVYTLTNNLKITLSENCENGFYVGQRIHFSYTLENMSEASVTLLGNIYPSVMQVIDLSTNTKIPYINRYVNLHPPVTKYSDDQAKTILAPKHKEFIINNLGYDHYGNAKVSDYLTLSKADQNLNLPSLFKPGRYKVVIGRVYQPGNVTFNASFIFEVKPAVGKISGYFTNYLNSLIADSKSREVEGLKLKDIIKTGQDNPYSSEAFYSLMLETNAYSTAMLKLRRDVNYRFELFQFLPNLPKCSSTLTVVRYIKQNIGSLAIFKNEGLVPDIAVFSDNFLKRISHMHKEVSNEYINSVEQMYNIKNLKNYSTQE